jgi:glycosyltransferase 2 family protein
MTVQGLRQKFIFSVILGIAVVLALSIYGDGSALLPTFKRFAWAYLPLILGLTLGNYALRFVKWHYYLDQLRVAISFEDSLTIFTAGLSMAVTPGKAGEVLKPILLRLRTGSAISRTVPVIVAERLTDGIAMVILALTGLLLSRQAWQVLVASVLLAGVLVGLLGSSKGSDVLRRLALKVPFLKARTAHLEAFLASSRTLFSPRSLSIGVALGVVSWSGEAFAFYLVLLGLGFHASWLLLVKAIFILCTSTLVGSLSMLPGGLGAVDASVTGLLLLLVRASRAKAAAATLLIRFCTLWFGVAIGLLTLFLFRNRFALTGLGALQGEEISPAPVPGS